MNLVRISRGLVLVALLPVALSAAESSAIGMSARGKSIVAGVSADDDLRSKKTCLLLVGSDNSPATIRAVQQAHIWFHSEDATRQFRNRFILSTLSCANPDGEPTVSYPPKSGFYDSPHGRHANYLWRWIGMYGPDIVIVVRPGEKLRYSFQGPDSFVKPMQEKFADQGFDPPGDDLAVQLARVPACDVGLMNAVAVELPPESGVALLPALLAALNDISIAQSPARKELLRRLDRTPAAVAAELSQVYGRQFKQVAYIPALALVGRLRLGELTKDPSHRADVEGLVRPYFEGLQKTEPKSGSEQAGHLIFSELAARSQGKERERYIELAQVAADQIFDKDGRTLPLMPFHNEMSDAVFMAGPILAATGKLTGDVKYFDACATHLESMRELCLRRDGLYRHSPLTTTPTSSNREQRRDGLGWFGPLAEAAWGRGNGFPALGQAWVLSEFPNDHPARRRLLEEFQKHMAKLLKYQDASGCWRQVIDEPASYREFTCTAMIGWAMQRGVQKGWLEKKTYQGAIDRAWEAIKLRIGPEGSLVDVCTGTGKQKSLQAYYDRPAILGRDDRGGAMALLFAIEILAATEGSAP